MLRIAMFALATCLLTDAAMAQPSPVQHIQIGDLGRTYLLERFHADRIQGRLPVIIFLHGLGTRITEGVPARFDIRFPDEPEMAPALIVRPQGVDRR